jgi:nucleotide-binding universal stress UspA family protein
VTGSQQPPRPIVAGVDAAPSSRDAAVLAGALCGTVVAAGQRPALLLAAVVVEPRLQLPEPLRRDDAAHAREQLDRAVELLRAECAPAADTRVLRGRSAARVLHELAERERAAIVVLGSSRRAAPGQAFAGRTARQVLNDSPCAISLAARGLQPPGAASPFALRRIVVGVDGSHEGAGALVAARTLSARSGAALHVVAVADESLGLSRAPLGQVAELASWDEAIAQRREHAQRLLAAALGGEATGGATTGEVLVGDPPEELANTAAGADLLVVGSRQWGRLAHVVIGATAEELLRGAPCSLLLVPRPRTEAAAG